MGTRTAVSLLSNLLLVTNFVNGLSLSGNANVPEGLRSKAQQLLASEPDSDAVGSKFSFCLPIEELPLADKNLTVRERAALPSICWRSDLLQNSAKVTETNGRGVPTGVSCDVTTWCDEAGYCSEVCERGSVEIEVWLQNALKTQLAITRQQPMCYATLPGTHNSGITLADGYGNLDPQFQEYFKWIKWVADDAFLRTNDHYFSLTDQLNLGVRAVELDTHEVSGSLRIAHCGGYHGDINLLIDAVNVVAKLLGHPIHWDTETIGCNPSLSSIPVLDQRTFLSALQEVAAWLELPGNEHEFVVLYLDDQRDVMDWGVLPKLLQEIQSVFPLDSIFTPLELDSKYNGTWPSIDTLSAGGKKVVFVTGYDYGEAIDAFMFSKEGRKTICGWREPDFKMWSGAPVCLADGNPFTGKTLAGTLFRIITCDLYYGPMNCDFIWSSSNDPLLDASSLPDVYQCGLNMPSPDLLTPEVAASTIWTWAPGEPFHTPQNSSWLLRRVSNVWKGITALIWGDAQECAAINVMDGRWRALSCSISLPTACRDAGGDWKLQHGPRGECPPGTTFQLPENGKSNSELQRVLKRVAHASGAWLPLQGPDWSIPNSPLFFSNQPALT